MKHKHIIYASQISAIQMRYEAPSEWSSNHWMSDDEKFDEYYSYDKDGGFETTNIRQYVSFNHKENTYSFCEDLRVNEVGGIDVNSDQMDFDVSGNESCESVYYDDFLFIFDDGTEVSGIRGVEDLASYLTQRNDLENPLYKRELICWALNNALSSIDSRIAGLEIDETIDDDDRKERDEQVQLLNAIYTKLKNTYDKEFLRLETATSNLRVKFARENTSQANKSRTKSVQAINLETGETLNFQSLREASQHFKVDRAVISRVLKKNQDKYKGHKLIYKV